MPAADHPHSPTPAEVMAYLDGEAPPVEAAQIASHLAGCKECEMVAQGFRRLSQQTAEWQVEAPPASMAAPTAARASRGRGRLLHWPPSRLLLTGLATAAALLVVVSFTQRDRRTASVPAPAVDSRAEAADALGAKKLPGRVAGLMSGVNGGSRLRDQGQSSALAQIPESQAPARASSIVRTASLSIVATDFSGVRAAVEAIVSGAGGFIDQMTITGDTGAAHVLRGTLRVPGERMAGALARLRQLGQVVEDTQGSEDVSDQIVDLDARLASGRATEQRLTQLLRERTGKLSDVLEVERELTRVRLDIERLDAEKTNVGRRVSYATIGVTIAEARKAGLESGPLPLMTRIRIAGADGLEAAIESVALAVLFLLRAGPTLLLWAVCGAPLWFLLRRKAASPIHDRQ